LYLLIDQLRQQGTSVILCSHVLPGVEAHINRAAILAGGQLEAVGTLTSLRTGAGLPSRIRATGLKQREQVLQSFSSLNGNARPLGGDGIELTGSAATKRSLLRQLLDRDQPGDIDILQPSLEDLYRFYTERASRARAAEDKACTRYGTLRARNSATACATAGCWPSVCCLRYWPWVSPPSAR